VPGSVVVVLRRNQGSHRLVDEQSWPSSGIFRDPIVLHPFFALPRPLDG